MNKCRKVLVVKSRVESFLYATNRRFSWVYKEGENGYDNRAIEETLVTAQGGSVDLTVDHDTGISLLKINNSAKRNAFSGNMMVSLKKAVEKLSSWKNGKALILYGANHQFCSGADLNTVRRFSSKQEGEKMCMYMQNTLTLLHQLPLLTVAFVEGKAIGGGAELLTACDFRLINEDAEIQFVHKKMGLTPGWGGVTRLVRLIGRDKALHLLSASNKISAQDALHLGLVDKLVQLTQRDLFREIRARAELASKDLNHEKPLQQLYSPDITVHIAIDWLQTKFDLDNTDPKVLQAIKASVTCCSNLSLLESLKNERNIFKSVWGGEANLKALDEIKFGK
ncbi:ethylmalonyl-CoA decarboxylase-like [Clavelina lepadiformis]|uniref:ethylmalonyl-CoA decarboxylase-like n=1 Tax=Clavelina lepadiformis TaxID=159417 RepID=UPI0040415517